MCNPVAIVMAASAVMSAVGQIQAGQSQKKMAEYNARVAEDTARYQATRQQDRVQRMMAGARVAINKSGLTMSGSPLDVLADSATQAELDHQAILRGGAAQAGMDRSRGRVAQQAGYFGAATSLLKGAGSVMGALGGGTAAVDAGQSAGLASNGIYWSTPRIGAV